jgi:hypothetical protein
MHKRSASYVAREQARAALSISAVDQPHELYIPSQHAA